MQELNPKISSKYDKKYYKQEQTRIAHSITKSGWGKIMLENSTENYRTKPKRANEFSG